MMRHASSQGFTLVEMMVALTIFALLAAGGVSLLRSSVDTQGAVADRLGAIDAQQRVVALFASDVGQAIARPLDGIGEDRRLPFEGTTTSMSMMRAGWANIDRRARSTLQRVEWKSGGGGIVRVAHLFLDGSDPGQAALMMRDGATAHFRYRLVDGRWVESFRSTPKELMPVAVELTAAPKDGPPLTIVVALPPRGLEPDDTSEKTPSWRMGAST